jgi:hypothetical protein
MGVLKWKREEEFKRVFQGQMKRMTKDGLDTVVHIAMQDMAEVSGALSVLCCCAVHQGCQAQITSVIQVGRGYARHWSL